MYKYKLFVVTSNHHWLWLHSHSLYSYSLEPWHPTHPFAGSYKVLNIATFWEQHSHKINVTVQYYMVVVKC